MQDPKTILIDILRKNWDDSKMPYEASRVNNGQGTRFHTGWYSRYPDRPIITLTAASTSVAQGGSTAITGTGINGTVQTRVGGLEANCVVGQESTLANAGPNGSKVDPDNARWQMYDHLADIFIEENLHPPLHTIAPGPQNEREDDGEGGMIYRMNCRLIYTYQRD